MFSLASLCILACRICRGAVLSSHQLFRCAKPRACQATTLHEGGQSRNFKKLKEIQKLREQRVRVLNQRLQSPLSPLSPLILIQELKRKTCHLGWSGLIWADLGCLMARIFWWIFWAHDYPLDFQAFSQLLPHRCMLEMYSRPWDPGTFSCNFFPSVPRFLLQLKASCLWGCVACLI